MAVDVRSPTELSNDSTANFRSWGQALGAALVAVGLVKCTAVEVTGQINWGTVNAPSAADQSMGFEVFKFADALQATSPVFIRVAYGSSRNNALYPAITVVVVNGPIDSAGNPAVGVTTAPYSNYIEFGMNNHYGGVWANGTFQTSGSPSRFAQRWVVGAAASYGVEWGVERTKNADGSDNGDGVIFQCRGASLYNRVQSWFQDGGAQTAGGGFHQIVLMNNGDNANQMRNNYLRAPLVLPAGQKRFNASGVFGANTAVYPWLLPSPRGYENPGMNFVGVWAGNVGLDAQFAARMYGADHNYRMGNAGDFVGGGWMDDTSGGAGPFTGAQQLQAAIASAMRWE